MAQLLGETTDANNYSRQMNKVKEGYNRCWNGYAYRHPEYNDCTDDRVQALAVVSGMLNKINIRISLTCLRSKSMLVRTWRNMLWKHSL